MKTPYQNNVSTNLFVLLTVSLPQFGLLTNSGITYAVDRYGQLITLREPINGNYGFWKTVVGCN